MIRGAARVGRGLNAPGRACWCVFGLITIAACASQGAPPLSAQAVLPAPPRPPDCITVAAGSDLQSTVDGAQGGESFCLEPGSYSGPLTLDKRVEIWGPREAVIRSAGEGTTIQIEGNGAALVGLTVDGSGGRFDTLDAAVHVVADDVRVEGVRVQGAAFGLLIEKANRASILNNVVQGPDDGPLGGWVLSHDQVEAALMRRAGYEVRVMPVEGGSREENPTTLPEHLRRDLRLHCPVRPRPSGGHSVPVGFVARDSCKLADDL